MPEKTATPPSPPVSAPPEAPPEPIRRPAKFAAEVLDPNAIHVVERLRAAGFTAYLVGGCVRDLLAGLLPKDFDVATDARPQQIRRLFRTAHIIGRRFRLVHVRFGTRVVETSTFRRNPRDGEVAEEGEDVLLREDNVFGTPWEDARRRDFPLNGLFWDAETHEVIDYVGGLADVDGRVIQTIGDPWLRFREDPVRMMRACKFAARLRFAIAPQTWQAIRDCHADILRAAPARLLDETYKILKAGASSGSFRLLHEAGLVGDLWPELASALAERPDALERFAGRLRVLDGHPAERERHGNPLLLAPLLFPLAADLVALDREVDEHALDAAIEDRLRPIATRYRVARRDIGWARLIIHSQRRFLGWGRQRIPARDLVVRDYFDAALEFLRMRAIAGEAPATLVDDWRTRASVEAHRPRVMSLPPPRQRRGGRRRGR